jgi:hypothetical protein
VFQTNPNDQNSNDQNKNKRLPAVGCVEEKAELRYNPIHEVQQE